MTDNPSTIGLGKGWRLLGHVASQAARSRGRKVTCPETP